MGLIKKRGIETIDYTYLQKKGLIKRAEPAKNGLKVDSQGMVDLTSQSATPTLENSDSNPFGFLDSLAKNSTPVNNADSSFSTINSGVDNPDINAMKIKIEDLEFKLGQLIDKLSIVETKLGSFESKVY